MKLTLRLRYQTQFGQSLFICGNHPSLGGGKPENAPPLHYVNADFWEITLDLPDGKRAQTPVTYYFLLRDIDGSTVEDFGGDRSLDLAAFGPGPIVVQESWNDLGTVENVFYTEPFKNVLLHAEPDFTVKLAAPASHVFQAKAPALPSGQTLCLLGIGGWNPDAPVLLRRCGGGVFRAAIDLTRQPFPIAYKYGIYDLENRAFVRYEDGDNRALTEAAPPGGRMMVNDGFARLPSVRWRGAGVAIPVFSLRSERGFGVGEFSDLILLADWARKAGLKLIQILPVNDTIAAHAWMDSYPYAAISAFALHPLYLNLNRLIDTDTRHLLKELSARRAQLNALPAMDYEAVMAAKIEFARGLFPARREATLAGADYKAFFAQNKHWLEPYTAFCFLRDKFGTADFNQWPEHKVFNAKKIKALAANDATAREEMDFHCFIQFHLHLQLREAADYIHAQGLILKGDIAIGVSPHSAEVWQQPELFHIDMQAGAPPDAFAAKGQNWGFPTYIWPRMKEDGYDWWKRRFAQMGHYFDAFRIDHILGFFRIWSIPRHAVEGILGYFVPALPVQPAEFAARGIAFDRDRFVRPFINDAVLWEMFGDRAAEVKRDFLTPVKNGLYSLKPKFATQRDVEKFPLKEKLFDLISNVLLLETPGGELHFRLGMEQTASFQQLDPDTRARLKDLAIDYFYRRQDAFWKREALQKLPALKRVTNMLICGEDLGMVPDCVPGVMKQLGLLGLEIQRMPKALGVDFSRPASAPYLSVVTPSSHDMSTIRGWWLEDRKVTQQFFNEELNQPGPAPAQCEAWINREIIRQHLDSPAMWSIFQLQDLLGMDYALRNPDVEAERINVPAIPRYYWRYRMHVSLETLNLAENFNWLLSNLVQHSGR